MPAAPTRPIVLGCGRLRQIRSVAGTLPHNRTEIAARLETGALARMASGPDLIHFDQQGVTIAVEADGLDVLVVARGVPLAPVLSARAGPERHAALGQRAMQGLVIHPSDHEHLKSVVLLNDSGDES